MIVKDLLRKAKIGQTIKWSGYKITQDELRDLYYELREENLIDFETVGEGIWANDPIKVSITPKGERYYLEL